MEKRMLYKNYKQRYANCKTLNDYDPDTKSITVIMPDTKTYKNISKIFKIDVANRWIVVEHRGFCIEKIQACHTTVYVAFFKKKIFSIQIDGKRCLDEVTSHKRQFYDKEEAFKFVEEKFMNYKFDK